jgi:hypothetical protein
LRAALRASETKNVCQRKYGEREKGKREQETGRRGNGGGEIRKGKLTDLRNGSNDEKDDDEPRQRRGELIAFVRIRFVDGAGNEL